MSWVVGVAFLWGWAEATWFFVVPDVWLTFTVFWGRTAVWRSILAATLGAMAGAVTLYALSPDARAQLTLWWSHCPGYAAAMFPVVRHQLADGPSGLLRGPWIGIPYRFYLKEAIEGGMSLLSVAAWTPLARLPRLLLAPATAGLALWLLRLPARWLDMTLPEKPLLATLITITWISIYWDYWFAFVPTTYP